MGLRMTNIPSCYIIKHDQSEICHKAGIRKLFFGVGFDYQGRVLHD